MINEMNNPMNGVWAESGKECVLVSLAARRDASNAITRITFSAHMVLAASENDAMADGYEAKGPNWTMRKTGRSKQPVAPCS